MTDTRRYLLTRCLRLELRIEQLERKIAAERPRAYRHPTPSDIARMRDLRRLGRTNEQIARLVGFSDSTVNRHTKDVLMEREVGAL